MLLIVTLITGLLYYLWTSVKRPKFYPPGRRRSVQNRSLVKKESCSPWRRLNGMCLQKEPNQISREGGATTKHQRLHFHSIFCPFRSSLGYTLRAVALYDRHVYSLSAIDLDTILARKQELVMSSECNNNTNFKATCVCTGVPLFAREPFNYPANTSISII